MTLLQLAGKSLFSRRTTVSLLLFSLTLSVTLLLAIDRIRHQAESQFYSSVSGIDLIVGARSSDIPLLLSSVFHIGQISEGMSLESYQQLKRSNQVAWAIPIALGDSHRGYSVVATDQSYFEHFQYGQQRAVSLAKGKWFSNNQEIVLGSEVADALQYTTGTRMELSHGAGPVSFAPHAGHTFQVSGLLAPTGTPVDRSLFISLGALNSLHKPATTGQAAASSHSEHDHHAAHSDGQDDHALPERLTAAFLGLKDKRSALQLQSQINRYRAEPLQAVIPGVALHKLWQLLGGVETALNVISWLVLLVSLAGMVTAFLTSMDERRHELAVLRALGARPYHALLLLLGESLLLAITAGLLGWLLLLSGSWLVKPLLLLHYGIAIEIPLITPSELGLLAAITLLSLLAGLWPASKAYSESLSSHLS